MTDRERRQQTRHAEEDAIFNRMLIWLAGAVVAEVLLIFVKKFYCMEMQLSSDLSLAIAQAMRGFFSVFQILGLVVVVAAGAWLYSMVKKGDTSRKLITVIVLAAAGFLWLISFMGYWFYDVGMEVLTYLPPAAAVLILVYFLYQRTFFYSALLTAGGMVSLWILHEHGNTSLAIKVGLILALIILVAAAGATWYMEKNDGKFRGKRLLPVGTIYPVIYVSCAVNAVALLLGLILGAGASIYLFFALAAWLFGQAVFFTVKLM